MLFTRSSISLGGMIVLINTKNPNSPLTLLFNSVSRAFDDFVLMAEHNIQNAIPVVANIMKLVNSQLGI